MTIARGSVLGILLVVEVFLLVVCLSLPFSGTRPHRRADQKAFAEYWKDQGNIQKRDAWIEERRRTNRVSIATDAVIVAITLANAGAIIQIWRRRKRATGLAL